MLDKSQGVGVIMDGVDSEFQKLLGRFRNDHIPFQSLRERLSIGTPLAAFHAIEGPVAPPPPDSIQDVTALSPTEDAALRELGTDALSRGELAVVVLAGGMATRFGGVVKALAPLSDNTDLTFLDVKLADFGAHKLEVCIMSSFATQDALELALASRSAGDRLSLSPQFASFRLQPNGELFLGKDGQPSRYATGHGDLTDALVSSGHSTRWKQQGVRTILVMNVDNLGATIDPLVLGAHLASRKSVTAELVRKHPGDRGGVAALHGGHVKLCEAFRLPSDFPHEMVPCFNTNTLWVDIEALDRTYPWTWCAASKRVDDREAIQFERLIGELTWWLPSHYLLVSREGTKSRFLPIKEMGDLRETHVEIRELLRQRLNLSLT
ncbi:MAG: UTP--glucose-1-phosphate uridylyltransferase [Deltaproteobacteria bacterium]|nr:UTP--glucose-1-phosphate uridylyltransferase [Deltaproteobacteria bacterium]